jgi:hypothetical protein
MFLRRHKKLEPGSLSGIVIRQTVEGQRIGSSISGNSGDHSNVSLRVAGGRFSGSKFAER